MAVCTTSSAQPPTGGRSSDTRHPARPSRAARFTEIANSTGHFIVLPTLDFSLLVEPSTATAVAGTSVNLKVSTATTGGYTGLTSLSTGSLPTGVAGTFTPPTLGPNASSLLTLSTSGSTPSSASSVMGSGLYNLLISFESFVKSDPKGRGRGQRAPMRMKGAQ